ncbi:MAG: EamA-like transporter family protein [Microgenomates bacterium OLB23]|nr:MAG: EamA-like transporter family protein [Microgenomates bacterium OLB23]
MSLAKILQRVLMKGDKSDPYSYAIVFHFAIGLFNLVLMFITGKQVSINSGNLPFLLITSSLWALCTVFHFKALQLVDAAEVTILSNIKVIVTIGASIVFLHEVFNIQKMFGAIIILAATILATNLRKDIKLNVGVLYSLTMGLFAGLALIADSVNVKHIDVASYNTLVNFISGAVILCYYPKALKQWKHFAHTSFLKKMLPVVILSTVQGIAYLMALTTPGVTGQVGAIRNSSVIVTVILGIVILNER